VGLFNRLLSPPELSLEEHLEVAFLPLLQPLSETEAEARELFRQLLFEVKEEATEEGTDQLPNNFGDLLLEHEATNETIRALLVAKRREGVTDEDLRSWWNQPDGERRLLLKVDDLSRMVHADKLRQQGLSLQEATQQAFRSQVCYGDPDLKGPLQGDDRPLPPEFRARIERYINSRMRTDPERYRQELTACSSLNAHLRLQMRKGNL
jgi:hypothetical protein